MLGMWYGYDQLENKIDRAERNRKGKLDQGGGL